MPNLQSSVILRYDTIEEINNVNMHFVNQTVLYEYNIL